MSTLNVNNQTLNAQSVLKIRQGQELAARETAKKDGADNVFFKVGNDTYVASGKGFNLKDVQPGAKFEFNGKQAQVVSIDSEVNSAKDGLLRMKKPATWMVGTGAAVGTVGGLASSLFQSVFAGRTLGALLPVLKGIGMAGGAMAAVTGVVAGISAIRGATRSQDYEALKAHAE